MLSEMQHFTFIRANSGFLLLSEHYESSNSPQPDRINQVELSADAAKKMLKLLYKWYESGHMPELSINVVCGDLHIAGYVYDLNEFGESR